jgi:hypothetical protein
LNFNFSFFIKGKYKINIGLENQMVPTLAHSGEGQGKHLIEDYVLETPGSALSVKTRNHVSAYFWPPLCMY